MADRLWKVVGGRNGGVLVRKGQSTTSEPLDRRLATGASVREVELLGERLSYKKLSGEGPNEGWVTIKLGDKDLLIEVPSPKTSGHPQLPRVPIHNPDVPAILASDLFAQLEKELSQGARWDASSTLPTLAQVPNVPDRPSLQLAAAPAETAPVPPPAADEHATAMTVNIADGLQEGVIEMSESVRRWLDDAKTWLARLKPSAKVPASVRLPAHAATNWEAPAAVLFALTHGQFDPERDFVITWEPALQTSELISMVCATSDGRRAFHPLVYENFRKQTYEPRELIVIHTGEMPSDFFNDTARDDPRVIYRFFPVTREAPGSPRISDEQQSNPWAAVLVNDRVEEVATFQKGGPDPSNYDDEGLKELVKERGELVPPDASRAVLEEIVRTWGDPGKVKIFREGWTKGLKRNIGVAIARGQVISHCDDGCLYGPDYLSRMRAELLQKARPHGAQTAAAVALSKWYTMAVAEQEFRLVDLKQQEAYWDDYPRVDKKYEQEQEQFNHGFAHMYTRAAWRQQPFPDVETVATSDSGFMRGLLGHKGVATLVTPSTAEGLAACGWHRDATAGAVDVVANINTSLYLNFMRFRGYDVHAPPKMFKALIPSVKEVASQLHHRRERYLKDLVEEHGSVYVCSNCNFAVAMRAKCEETKELWASKCVFDAVDVATTLDKDWMKFQCAYLSAAGGVIGEGSHERVPAGNAGLQGKVQRNAICRNCGWQLGWRYEPQANGATWDAIERAQRRGQEFVLEDGLTPLEGPVYWCLIWRHLRERQKAGEFVPTDDGRGAPRHAETQHNQNRDDVCPSGHRLYCFSTGQGNGGALPLLYTCDLCDRDARWNEHYYGCGTCDYDICEKCKFGRSSKKPGIMGRLRY